MIEFLSKDYSTREELNMVISAEVGRDIKVNRNAGHTIKGTRKNLKRLYLDDTSTVWGCKVVITDNTTKKLIEKRNENKKK